MARRTYNLADEMIARFEALVPPEKRDEVMNQIIERWLEEQRLIELRVNVIEGLNDTENEDLSARV